MANQTIPPPPHSSALSKTMLAIILIVVIVLAGGVSAGVTMIAGPQGPAGPKGDTGATGATGPMGPAGLKGDTGATGSAGPAGSPGSTGATGAIGATGATGATGAAGPQGLPGPSGAPGPTGAQGPRGYGVPQKGNISVSFSAFKPPLFSDNVQYSYINGLVNLGTYDLSYCYAPLQLPHGATITNATFYLYDQYDNGTFLFDVCRSNASASFEQIGYVWKDPASGTTGYNHVYLGGSHYSYNLNIATVDNNNYEYYILMLLPHSDHTATWYRFYYALIEYQYP